MIESPRYLASLVAVANRCSRVASMQECADACVVWNNSRIAVFGVEASPGARYGNGSRGVYAGQDAQSNIFQRDVLLPHRNQRCQEKMRRQRRPRQLVGDAGLGFSETVLQSTSYTPDLKRIDEGIDHIRLGAATALFDAVYLASRSLDRRQGRKVMVLITDGGDTISKIDYKEAVRAAEEAEAIVYSIIVVPIENSAGREIGGEHALIQLSDDTGGKYYYATSMSQLDDAFRQISDELRTQYLLAYYPSQRTSNSQFRRIQVSVSGPPDSTTYQVRHRAGYYTMKSDF